MDYKIVLKCDFDILEIVYKFEFLKGNIIFNYLVCEVVEFLKIVDVFE